MLVIISPFLFEEKKIRSKMKEHEVLQRSLIFSERARFN